MDDYTWERHIHERRYNRRKKRHKERLILGIAVILLFVLGTWTWYFFFHARTPEFALSEIQSAIKNRDAETFSRYVNLPLLTAKAYDDLTNDLFAFDPSLTPQSRIMYEKFYVLIRPQMTAGTADIIQRRIDTGVWEQPSGTNILKGQQLGIDFYRFMMMTQLWDTSFVSIESIERDGSMAVATIHVRNDETGIEYDLEVDMEKSADGRWQAAYIRNYRGYLDACIPVQIAGMEEYVKNTDDLVKSYNISARKQRAKFASITNTTNGTLSRSQINAVDHLLSNETIPGLLEYKEELAKADIPPGAHILAELRAQSIDTTIDAWTHYLRGLKTGNQEELETAETLHKRELELDMRISDIIHRAAVSRNLPNIP